MVCEQLNHYCIAICGSWKRIQGEDLTPQIRAQAVEEGIRACGVKTELTQTKACTQDLVELNTDKLF